MHLPHKLLMVKNAILILLLAITTSCATYYEKNIELQSLIAKGNFASAEKLLTKDTKSGEGINRMLYWCNSGVVAFMNGKYELSNTNLNKADLYIEDYSKSLGNEALALLTNPMVKPYKPEDFEAVMIHYYKAINYIYLKDYEGALVEAKRINIVLNKFNEKYKENKNKYTRDAFSHLLMGIIYEASGDVNNAFIAYRNAFDVYEQDYVKLFNTQAPLQLKKDLIRTAAKLGFGSERDFYERKFGLKYEPEDPNNGSLVFFWMNGLVPVKGEWSINFVNTGYNNGWITFANSEYGLSYPIYIGGKSSSDQGALRNLSVLRVSFPKFLNRQPLLSDGKLVINNQHYKLELAEDINKIAYQCLNDRMLRELATGILRLATKKAVEYAMRNQNQNLGAVFSIVNAMTEKADTRNWQSLPYSISYCRASLPVGVQNVALETTGKMQSNSSFTFNILKGQTTFYAFHNLESSAPSN